MSSLVTDSLTPGYWEPHSSSVDFCEPNYLFSHYVAEPHNVWSSLFITAIALVGLFNGNPSGEISVSMMYLVLAAVGIGSAGLHSTLHWIYQSSDEVPMLWQILTFLHMLWINNKEKDPNSWTPGIVFLALAIVQTVVYYKFQQIYAVFIVSIVVYSIIIILWMYFLIQNTPDSAKKQLRLRIHHWAFLCYVVFGTGLWIIDMNLCPQLLPIYHMTTGFTLHVFWHIFAGLGTYLTAVNLTVMRLQDRGDDVDLKFIGFLPIPYIVKPGTTKN
jgi:dihydroceramidase